MRRRVTMTGLLLAVGGALLLAQDNPPTEFKHPDAKKAKAALDAAIVSAHKTYAADLENALKSATMSGDLDEALKIREAINKALKDSAADSTLNLANERKTLVGVWAVRKKNGYKAEWTFHADGTVTSTAGVKLGMWSVETDNRRVFVHWEGKLWDSFDLPINPKGATGQSWDTPGKGSISLTKTKP